MHATAGELTKLKQFWSQAEARYWAATVAGSAAPVTKPKYLPPALATVAGDPWSSRKARISPARLGSEG